MKLADLVRREAIVPELAATERNGVIRELVQALADAGAIAPEAVERAAKSIITRERSRGTTGFGKGMAVPHAKIEDQAEVVAAVGRSTQGVDFASLDGEPVYGVFLILSPVNETEQHLQAMDLVFRNLHQEKFRNFLKQSDTAAKIHDLLVEADEGQFSS